MKKVIIGIDPDTEKNGIAIYKNNEIELLCLDLFAMFDMINKINIENYGIYVVIEKGQNNKALFNAISAGTKAKGAIASKMRITANVASKIGRNFELTNIIEKWCIYMGIDYSFYTPQGAKYTHKQVKEAFKITKQTNPEKRDALRCISQFITKIK